MNYIKLFIFLILSLITVYLISIQFSSEKQQPVSSIHDETKNIDHQSDLMVNADQINKDLKPAKNNEKLDSVRVSEFNNYILNDVNSTFGYSNSETIIDELLSSTSAIDANESSIEWSVKEIIKIKENPESKSLITRELYSYCDALQKHLKSTNNRLELIDREKLRGKYFLMALNRSEYCSSMGTKDDPFFQLLKLARKGDQLAQLFLIEDFYQAIERKLIRPKLYPLEYNALRNEIVSYLEQLSAGGVQQATFYLAFLYDNDNSQSKISKYVPEDKVLQYFYLMRIEKQYSNWDMDLPWVGGPLAILKSPLEVYQSLSKSEKNKADRMLERAGY